jgi:hypothetical protein
MLKMKVAPGMCMKRKRQRKERTIAPDMLMKIHGLRDNRGEARMLLKRNDKVV